MILCTCRGEAFSYLHNLQNQVFCSLALSLSLSASEGHIDGALGIPRDSKQSIGGALGIRRDSKMGGVCDMTLTLLAMLLGFPRYPDSDGGRFETGFLKDS